MRCNSIVIRISEGVVFRCFSCNARTSVSSSVVFVGPVVQSARFHDCKKSVEVILAPQSRASFPRAVRKCQILISWQAQLFERFACRCNVIFRDRRSTLELCVQI